MTTKPETTEAKGEIVADVKPEPKTEAAAADPLLVQILSTRRSHGSTGDTNFRIWLFNYIKNTLKLPATVEVEGNVLVQTDPRSTVLFSCHIDTVHSNGESNGQPQQLAFDPAFNHLFLADKSASGCLGGDDGCGVYIMLKMLKAGVKGKFIFHTGEERGGIGSSAFVNKRRQFCEDLEMVVAFDRAVRSGENPEVIITQGGKSCASKAFGEALCKELNKVKFENPYVISHKGTFTDSKNYSHIVPECVNIGCFYEKQHGPNEYVDVAGLELLVKAACQVEWSKLPIERKVVAEPEFDMFDRHLFGVGKYPAPAKGAAPLKFPAPQKSAPKAAAPVNVDVLDEMPCWVYSDYGAFVDESPEEAATALMRLQLRVSALEAELHSAKTMLGVDT